MTDHHPDRQTASCDVLIVEDNTFMCDVIATFLTQRGISVRTAPAASAALALLETVTPKIAIFDYYLPGMNGLELAEAMRGLGLDLPIIMMSASNVGTEEATLRQLGVRIFLKKPVPLSPLHQAIVRLLRAAG